ncbi:MAG TPA: LysE family transporter [Bacteroidales bacterium]|nr:LysE family transporter [Bacteroidales bacterium]HNS46750.1 LysE family transporter [Bacteroidales bacterium]
MFNIFLQGVILGLLISVTAGPSFITILQTSLQRGFNMAFFIALGVLLSDAVLITICYLGASIIITTPSSRIYIGMIGGIILIAFGLWTFNRKPEILLRRSPKYKTPTKRPGPLTYIFKGFFLNFLNPFLLIFWFTAISWVASRAEEGKLLIYTLVFFSGTLATTFSLDLLKSFIGNKISLYIRPRTQLWINRAVGIALIAFGIFLIVKVSLEWL